MMTAAYTAPVRTRFATKDPDAAHVMIEATYTPSGALRMSTGEGDFNFGSDLVTAGELSVARVWNSAVVQARLERLDSFLTLVPLHGGLGLQTGAEDLRLGPGDCVRYSTEEAMQVTWEAAQTAVVSLPLQALHDAAELRVGPDPAGPRFSSMVPASAQLARYWRAALSFVDREMRTEDSVLGHRLIQEQTTRLLAEAALSVFPSPAMSPHYVPGPGRAAPGVVRRAIEFIETRAHEPLGVADIAAAAGIGVRGLQHAFLQHLGTSPLGYVRRVRLERAHRELQAADPTTGVTVRDVAARWGHANPGRFAAEYTKTYGVLPSQTLRS